MKILIFLTSLQPLLLSSLMAQQIPPVEKQTLVSITKETTFITEPLDELGFPDYYAHLNRRAVQIPHNENAGLDIIRVLGPDLIEESSRQELCRLLSLPEYPTVAQPFVTFKAFVKSRDPSKSEDEIESEDETLKRTLLKTWKEEDFPLVSEWLDSPSSKSTLDALKSIDSKNQYAIPYLVPGAPEKPWSLYSVLLHHTQSVFEMSKMLVCHSNRLTYNKQFEETSEWILRLHHLGRLADQQSFGIEKHIAYACDSMASQAEFVLATHPECPLDVLQRHQSRRNQLSPFGKLIETVDQDRHGLSQIFCLMARSQLFDQQETDNFLYETLGLVISPTVTVNQLASGLDYDLMLKVHQELYDDYAVFVDEPYETRHQLEKDFYQALDEMIQPLNASFSLELSINMPKRRRSELLSRWYTYRMFADFQKTSVSRDRTRIRATLVNTFLSIERYRRENSKLPEKLGDLVPQYLDQVPIDFYNGNSLTYKSTKLHYRLFSVGTNSDQSNKPLSNASYSTRDVRLPWPSLDLKFRP
jgi:hypothetical protein